MDTPWTKVGPDSHIRIMVGYIFYGKWLNSRYIILFCIQYKKSKEPPKCIGLFLLDEWTESLFDDGNVLSTFISLVKTIVFVSKIFVW